MGLQTADKQTPLEALFPTGTPAELKKLGHNLREVHSCAIPEDGRIRGCPFAFDCALRKFGNPDEGGFGPPDVEPGTPGQGPRNVGYFLQTQEGSSMEDYMRCSAYMTVLFNREQKQDETGEVIMVIAQEGERIETIKTVPVDPVLCNKNGNMTMKTYTEVIEVPKHARPGEVDIRQGVRTKMRKDRMEIMRRRRRERAGFVADTTETDDDARTERDDPPPPARNGVAKRVRPSKPLPEGKPLARPTNRRRPADKPPAGGRPAGDGDSEG